MSVSASEKRGARYVKAVRDLLPSSVLEESWQTPEQATVTVTCDALPDAVSCLVRDHDGWLSVAVGNDERPLNGHFAVYYVVSREGDEKCYVTVRGLVPGDTKEFPSVSPKVPAAVWSERELRDMYGLRPVGLTDERRLVLPDDWPDDLFPLRKDAMDYRLRPRPTTDTETYRFINDADVPTTVMPMGPLAVGSDEPGHFRLFVDGEDIIDADFRLFYVHRGMEKVAETRMGCDVVTFLADRICGICGFTHSVAYATSVENALGIEVPRRAHWIRKMLLEVERLHSHFLNLSLSCHFSGFHQLFRVREKGMELAEILTGSRKTYCLNLIGGLRRDILAEQDRRSRQLIKEMREEAKRVIDIFLDTPYLSKRMEGVGRLDPAIAREHAPVGPVVRGCGFRRDIRVDHPYAAYAGVPVEVQTRPDGEVRARALIRVGEFFNSLDIIEYCLEHGPPGPVLTEGFRYTPHRFALGYTEAPRGEDIHWSMLGNNQKLYRWRCRAASYSNWPSLRYMLRGNTIGDVPLIVANIDPCDSCTDRVTVVDVRKKDARVVEYKEMKRYCRERTGSPLK